MSTLSFRWKMVSAMIVLVAVGAASRAMATEPAAVKDVTLVGEARLTPVLVKAGDTIRLVIDTKELADKGVWRQVKGPAVQITPLPNNGGIDVSTTAPGRVDIKYETEGKENPFLDMRVPLVVYAPEDKEVVEALHGGKMTDEIYREFHENAKRYAIY